GIEGTAVSRQDPAARASTDKQQTARRPPSEETKTRPPDMFRSTLLSAALTHEQPPPPGWLRWRARCRAPAVAGPQACRLPARAVASLPAGSGECVRSRHRRAPEHLRSHPPKLTGPSSLRTTT